MHGHSWFREPWPYAVAEVVGLRPLATHHTAIHQLVTNKLFEITRLELGASVLSTGGGRVWIPLIACVLDAQITIISQF
ncbi:MAG TPA: hypothetical protein VGX70_18385 [Gemmataceae bacterium]|jgi:hypothetical protein|nr:hypothetical protein [Gemmataceae bacterium]